MPLRIMLLHIGEKDESSAELIHQMKNGVSSNGASDIPVSIPGNDQILLVNISDATQKIVQGKPCIEAKSGCGAGAILMYDTTRRKSFANCIHWIDAFKGYAPREAVILLLANRSNESVARRDVSEREGAEFAANVRVLYREVNRHSPDTAKKALECIVRNIHDKIRNGILGTKPHQGVIPISTRHCSISSSSPTSPGPTLSSPTIYSRPRHVSMSSSEQRGDNLPMIAALESKLSYAEEEMERMKKSHDAERVKQEQHEQQLIMENCQLTQELDSAKRQVDTLKSENVTICRSSSALEQEKSWLQQQLGGREREVERLNYQITSMQQMCAALQQDSGRISALEQENIRLNKVLKDQIQEQQQLQHRLRLKEEAYQNEVQCHAETRVALRETRLALSQATNASRISETEDHWKVSRREVHIKGVAIGHGAWGHVEEGEFRGKKVAVKCLHEAIENRQSMERVHREIRTMASVRHPNVVLFIAAVLDEGPPLIISELLDTNLRRAYENKLLHGTDAKIDILHGVACALNYLHNLQEPIIHRDISAPNILLNAAGNEKWTPKVSDFGSANAACCARTLGEGAIIYSAPETYPQSLQHSIVQTTKIDVYSYGVLVGELFTEQLPDPDKLSYTLQYLQGQWPQLHVLMVNCTNQNPHERPAMDVVITEYLDPIHLN